MNKEAQLHFYRKHIEEVLLPFWFRALDHTHGGVYTCFNNTGDRLVSKDKYTWSQGRFLWLWCKISEMISNDKLSGEPEDYYDHARKTIHFLEENVFLENGNCAFLLTESGEKKESIPGEGFDTSFYADCFIIIGMTAYAGLNEDVQQFDRALQLYSRIRMRIEAGEIRSEPYPIPEGYRSHSVPMIMLNVAQGLADVALKLNHAESKKLHQHSIAYMKDIMDRFYQKNHRVVEMLPDSHSERSSLLYRHINPGHTIESMWFVMHSAQKAGYSNYIYKAVQAIEKAVDLGWDSEYGGLFRFVDMSGGKPKGEKGEFLYEKMICDTWSMKLWWPHSEALYATLLAFKLTGDRTMKLLHEKLVRYVFKTFPNPDREIGEWIQIRDRKGGPLDEIAALPVKDPFHVLRNLLLIIDLLEEESKNAFSG